MTDAGRETPRRDNIVLIGYRGCGKSVVGRALAARLDRTFVDTDERIAQQARCTLHELFARYGQPDFRDREHRLNSFLIPLECHRIRLVVLLYFLNAIVTDG